MNSPWDPMSADSSRRSSMASNHGGGAEAPPQPGIGQHLNRLHRRAQQQQMMPTPSATPTMEQGRRGSDMSAMTTPTNPPISQQQQPPIPHQSSVRRASDPVRTLDRNFGVQDGQISRHQRSGSYNQINMGHQQRVPMHGQRIRGMSGDTYFHQQPPMVRKNDLLYFLSPKELFIREDETLFFFQFQYFIVNSKYLCNVCTVNA